MSLLDRLNQFSIAEGERNQPSGTTDLSVVSRGSGGSGELWSSVISTVGGVKPSHTSSGSENRSPVRETDNGHMIRERSEKRVSEKSDRGVAQHHHYYYGSRAQNDSVVINNFRGKAGDDNSLPAQTCYTRTAFN